MRCRGPCLASPHRSASCLASPLLRAARQSQEPARGSGFPTPPTSRSCLRAVPVSNGESISTASAQDSASPQPHHFLIFRCPHAIHRKCLVIRIKYRFSTASCTDNPQITRRNSGNTGHLGACSGEIRQCLIQFSRLYPSSSLGTSKTSRPELIRPSLLARRAAHAEILTGPARYVRRSSVGGTGRAAPGRRPSRAAGRRSLVCGQKRASRPAPVVEGRPSSEDPDQDIS
jgi:hypothetical protein